MSESSAYRNQAWGCCYAGAEGGDLALPLELGGIHVIVALLPVGKLDIERATTLNRQHRASFTTTLQLHLVPHHRLAKVVI